MKSKFAIVKNFKLFGIISILLAVIGFVSIVLLPFGVNWYNLDISFAGGTEMEFAMQAPVTPEIKTEIATLFTEQTAQSTPTVVEAGTQNVLIRSMSIDSEKRAAVIKAMEEKYQATLESNNDVSPSVGKDLQAAAFATAGIAVMLMLIYISIRFEFTSGLAAVTCLLHDLLVMLSFFVIFQIPLGDKFIAAALTILGYSINASIIVFDRVRENMRVARKEPFEDIAERSVWQTMGRTINTTVTTLLTVVMIFIMVPSLRDFMFPIVIGIACGAYSSIFLSSSLWGKYRHLFQRKHA